jgi:hypothetical protein
LSGAHPCDSSNLHHHDPSCWYLVPGIWYLERAVHISFTVGCDDRDMEETSMNGSPNRWVLGLVAIVFAVTLSAIAYNFGVSQGAAQMAASVSANAGASATTPPAIAPYDYRDGWRRHGWGYFPLFPLLFVFFWIFCFRMFWWGGGPWRHWGYYRAPYDRDTFDEWHRRAHDQMKS